MNPKIENLLVLAGAIVGGVLGILLFKWIAGQGFYALVLPGGLAGIGAGMRPCRSKAVGIICGLWALLAGIIAEWWFAPFIADGGFAYFLSHVHQLQPITLILIVIGGAIGFYLPLKPLLTGANRPA